MAISLFLCEYKNRNVSVNEQMLNEKRYALIFLYIAARTVCERFWGQRLDSI
jgi:hypothetical protein